VQIADRPRGYVAANPDGGLPMTLFAPHETETLLTKLDMRKLDAWAEYLRALEGLKGPDYDLMERDAWATLQVELRAIESERSDLISVTA
jgi:hypothetical protein